MESAATAWTSLCERAGAATPFQSLSVARACAMAHWRRRETPRIVLCERNGTPVVLFATVISRMFGLPVIRFLGDPLIQYGDVLAAPEATMDEFMQTWREAVNPDVACYALFRRVRDGAKIAAFLSGVASEVQVQDAPLFDLDTLPAFNKGRGREMRRLKRRLSEIGAVEFQLARGVDAVPWALAAMRLKREWLKKNSAVSTVIGTDNWEKALLDICSENDSVVAAAMTVAGRVAAVEIALVDDVFWYGFITAYDPEFAKASPGNILLSECLNIARNNGFKLYDHLPPSQEYKIRFSTDAKSVRDYSIVLSTVGRLSSIINGAIPELKAAFYSLPAEIRRPILRFSARYQNKEYEYD